MHFYCVIWIESLDSVIISGEQNKICLCTKWKSCQRYGLDIYRIVCDNSINIINP